LAFPVGYCKKARRWGAAKKEPIISVGCCCSPIFVQNFFQFNQRFDRNYGNVESIPIDRISLDEADSAQQD